ncbi:MAG: hypothetical protein ACLRS8_05675 [Parabacteroides merdae]
METGSVLPTKHSGNDVANDIGMLQTNLAEMEGGGEIIVADRPDTLRATTLALAQRGQFHSYAKIARR